MLRIWNDEGRMMNEELKPQANIHHSLFAIRRLEGVL